MAHIIVAASPATGHFTPMRAIAADLVQRGHDVTVTTGSRFRSTVEATGARFVPLQGAADFDADDEQKNFPEILSIPPGAGKDGFRSAEHVHPADGRPAPHAAGPSVRNGR